ncbi:MAG: oligosaccharide flippase family protein [Oligoflexales bacterium]|nr:oligosaccharide flippase family protein [Oligoflexales bacterium]
MSINRRRLSFAIATGLLVEVIYKITPLLILYHAQKCLGLVAFGWAQYGIALFETMQPFVGYGYSNFAMSEVSRTCGDHGNSRRLFSHIVSIRAVHAVLIISGTIIWSAFQPDGTPFSESAALLVFVMLATAMDSYWFVMASHKLAAFNLFGGITRLLTLAAAFVLIRDPQDKRIFMALMLLPTTLTSIVTGIYAFRHLRFSRPITADIRKIFFNSIPFTLISVLIIAYDRYDIFLAEHWFGLAGAGAYSGPAKLVQSLNLLTGSVVLAFYAEIVTVQDRQSLYRHTALSLFCLMAIVTPMVFGAPFLEKQLISIIFVNHSPSADGVFSLLIIGIMGNALIATFGIQLLQVKGFHWRFIWALLAGFVIGPFIALILKENLGLKSVVIGSLSSKALASVLVILGARGLIGQIPWASLTRTIMAGIVMASCLHFLHIEGIIPSLLVGSPVYMISLILLNRSEVGEIMRHPRIARFFGKQY